MQNARPEDGPGATRQKVTGGLFRFRVWTNANMIDDNPWFLFSREGRLVRAGGAARRSQQ
jgi:hypothetical protein